MWWWWWCRPEAPQNWSTRSRLRGFLVAAIATVLLDVYLHQLYSACRMLFHILERMLMVIVIEQTTTWNHRRQNAHIKNIVGAFVTSVVLVGAEKLFFSS